MYRRYNSRSRILLLWLFLISFSVFAAAQETDPSLLTLERIFNSEDFQPQGVGGLRWLKSGDAYSKIERSTTVKGGADLVSYDAATNKRDRFDCRRKADSERRNRSLCRLTATNGRRTTGKC